MTAPVGPGFLNVPLDVLVNRDLDKNGRDLLETLHKTTAATSTTASADLLLEPASKKQKLQSEPPVDSAEAALLRAGRKKPPWTPTEQAIVAIKHCELGNRWTQIAAYLPLRSENDVKNIWHSTLRCKDTQKRSFLRTYALAVHDHAYDYATRKAMFDIAVRQCGPPPPQASEMIARVQLLMDHPELQAAVQQQQVAQGEQQLQQHHHHHHQQDQFAQLTHLLQKREELQQHHQFAQLAQQLQHQQQLMLLQQHDTDDTETDEPRQGDAVQKNLAKAGSKDFDGRRARPSRDEYGGKYGDAYDESYDDAEAPGSEPNGVKQLQQLVQGQAAAALWNQVEPADARRGASDSGVSALRRYNASCNKPGQGVGAGAGGGGFSVAPSDSLPVTLAHMAAVAATEPAATAAAQAAGGEALPGPARTPGVPLPALGNLLALLYKYNIEQSQVAAKQLGAGAWAGAGGEEDDDGAPAMPVPVPGAEAAAEDDEDEANKAAVVAVAAGSQPQPLSLRPLALRPLQTKRERESDVKGDEEGTANGEPAEGSPKRQRGAGRRAAAADDVAAGPRESISGSMAALAAAAQPTVLRPRNSMPYSLQDADADELGAVEALALAARGSRGPGASGGRASGPAANGGGRFSGSSGPGGLVSIRNGASARAAANGAGNQSGPILDLHSRPAAATQPQSRGSMRAPASGPGEAKPPPLRQQQHSAAPTLDVISVLNMPGLRRQVLSLPAQTLVALLCSPAFGSDAEASVLLLVALWLQANKEGVTTEQAKAVCGAVRLAALGGFYLSAVLPRLLADPRVGGKGGAARPGGRWFEMRQEELAFLTGYIHAGSVERALLADAARGVYDCTLPWYDTTPRSLGAPSEGFCFEWHIPKQGLRDALSTGAQPHAAFTVNDDISDSDGGSADGGIAVVPYIICRGLEWHVFVDCQQRAGSCPGGAAGAAVAGVFVYCRVPGALRPTGASGSFVGVVPGAGIRLGVHGWRCGRLEEVFVWTFGDETYFVPDAGMGCPSALPLRKRPSSPVGGAGRGSSGDDSMGAWADYLHEGGLRGTLTFLPH